MTLRYKTVELEKVGMFSYTFLTRLEPFSGPARLELIENTLGVTRSGISLQHELYEILVCWIYTVVIQCCYGFLRSGGVCAHCVTAWSSELEDSTTTTSNVWYHD